MTDPSTRLTAYIRACQARSNLSAPCQNYFLPANAVVGTRWSQGHYSHNDLFELASLSSPAPFTGWNETVVIGTVENNPIDDFTDYFYPGVGWVASEEPSENQIIKILPLQSLETSFGETASSGTDLARSYAFSFSEPVTGLEINDLTFTAGGGDITRPFRVGQRVPYRAQPADWF